MNIGIIGYGRMGSSIFRLLAGKPHNITVLMRSEEKAKDREKKFFRGLERSLKRGAITEDEYVRKKESLKFTHRVEDLASADLVTETAVEDYQQKLNIFRKLESVINRKAVLVTNTSSISIEELAQELRYKERFCGLHFFYPVLLIDLVEIIRCADTPMELVSFLKDFCESIDKKPIVVHDAPGSVVNATLAYYYGEALYILEEGLALPSKVDELAKWIFYIGPCESMDVIGIDFFIEALERAATLGSFSPIRWTGSSQMELSKTATGGREGFFVPYLFGKLISENRLGKKVSKGIYLYQREKAVDDEPEFYVNPNRSCSYENIDKDQELIAKRLLYSIFNGSLYSLKKGMSSIEELDFGVKEVLQMKEGPFTMMRAIGMEKLKEEFDFLTRTAGKRFRQTTFEFLNE
jgi:3-hydroxybutyryl-CoA dehydrogenase